MNTLKETSVKQILLEVDAISNQLCEVIDGNFSILVTTESDSEIIQKLCMLSNFLLGCSREDMAIIEENFKKSEKVVEKLNQEISTRKATEKNLSVLHNEMLSLSRSAGISDATNSILHNVGNILNSITTSTDILMQDDTTQRIERAQSLLKDIHDVQEAKAFLTSDDKAPKILIYLQETLKLLIAREAKRASEIHSLKNNVNHIRKIIQVQQASAKMISVRESFPLKDLLHQAVALISASEEPNLITLNFTLEPDFTLEVDRHKLLQILANLLSNAKDATREMPYKKITVTVGSGIDSVFVRVEDNGIGISKASLSQLFHQGFTTKKEGHGFGLHACANLAKELGGKLYASSPGEGKGASFILEIPIKISEE